MTSRQGKGHAWQHLARSLASLLFASSLSAAVSPFSSLASCWAPPPWESPCRALLRSRRNPCSDPRSSNPCPGPPPSPAAVVLLRILLVSTLASLHAALSRSAPSHLSAQPPYRENLLSYGRSLRTSHTSALAAGLAGARHREGSTHVSRTPPQNASAWFRSPPSPSLKRHRQPLSSRHTRASALRSKLRWGPRWFSSFLSSAFLNTKRISSLEPFAALAASGSNLLLIPRGYKHARAGFTSLVTALHSAPAMQSSAAALTPAHSQ
mmetsp:Transcript_1110/g.4209  ORF Transcript_1110/g.4209 Transcript_1110/m.4209 type:complete len:266 (+) Transcript_1110:478-1275(+)